MDLEGNEVETAKALAADPTPEAYSPLAQVRRELKILYTTLVQFNVTKLNNKLFEAGDKNRKLLANLVAEQQFQMIIPEL